MNWRLISAGGASLRRHWNEGTALAAIREAANDRESGNGPFDYVVLQEQSTLPLKNPARVHENIRLFHEAMRAGDSAKRVANAPKIALYLTWARANAPAPRTQDAITAAYASIAREIGAVVVPVGIAWQRYLAAHAGKPPIALHDKDQSHPTLAGSYLAACVFFATLFGESRAGAVDSDLESKGLSAADQQALQRAAIEASA